MSFWSWLFGSQNSTSSPPIKYHEFFKDDLDPLFTDTVPVHNEELTERQIKAVKTLGFDSKEWNWDHVSLVLSARDYFNLFEYKEETPKNHREILRAMIKELVLIKEVQEPLRRWNQDTAREELRKSGILQTNAKKIFKKYYPSKTKKIKK